MGGFLILVLVCGLGGVADARGSLGVVGTPTHPQMLACFEEATQFTGILPPAGPHDIGFGAGYFPQARRLADMDPPNSGRDAQLTGYKLPPVVNPGATVTMTIAPGSASHCPLTLEVAAADTRSWLERTSSRFVGRLEWTADLGQNPLAHGQDGPEGQPLTRLVSPAHLGLGYGLA